MGCSQQVGHGELSSGELAMVSWLWQVVVDPVGYAYKINYERNFCIIKCFCYDVVNST